MYWKYFSMEKPKNAGYYLTILSKDDFLWPDVKIWQNKKWNMSGENTQTNVVKWSEIPPWG